MTKIKHVKEENSIQITMRFFIDDIEKIINNRFKKEFNLATNEELTETDKFLNIYIHQKFEVKINDQLIEYTFLGKEYDNDVMFFYLESTDIKEINSIEVKNKMLLEMFEEQQNYIKLHINDQIKTMVLMRENDKEMLKY
ncbi:MAG: peptidase E [Flavobacteriaceae bacterium]|nr:peptidase E [Flavobacteriaceae bacterium]